MYKQVLDNNAKQVFQRLRDAEKKAKYWKRRAMKAEKNVMIFSGPKVIADFTHD